MPGSHVQRFAALARSLGLVLVMAAEATAQGLPGSGDHPMVPRYPGSEPMGSPGRWRDFDEFTLVLGRVTGEHAAAKTQKVEGRVYTVTYRNPDGRSVLEIYRNYEQGLLRAGFQPLYSCAGEPCGAWENVGETQFRDPSYLRRLLVARLRRAQGDVYVSLLVQAQGPEYAGDTQLAVIETKAMETGLVTVDANAMGADITASGHVAVYGIYFDTGRADLKPESEPTLAEIARLLKQRASLRLHVIGHTDNVGDMTMNMDLSKRRAAAVAQALATRHGVTAARLRSDGVGPLAPVASNKTEEGRARNRRVELVEQ